MDSTFSPFGIGLETGRCLSGIPMTANIFTTSLPERLRHSCWRW